MKLNYLIVLVIFPIVGFSQVDFIWVDSIVDDFSFTEKWDYQEGIYENQWGQLSCDGLCPMEIDALKDAEGRIYDDSLTKFYSIVDTTHRFFSHEGTARVYEYGDCNYASAKKEMSKILVDTELNMATHTSLHLEFDRSTEPKLSPKAWLNFNSIRASSVPIKFNALRGKVEISKSAYAKGIVQMRFELEFQQVSNDRNGPQTWKGKILVALPK